MNTSKALGLIGIARKAGFLTVGTSFVRENIQKSKKCFLVLLASDASDNTKKRITDSCNFYNRTLITLCADSETLGHAIGKDAPIACVSVNDRGLSDAIISQIGSNNTKIGTND